SCVYCLCCKSHKKEPYRYCYWLTYRESVCPQILKIQPEKRKPRFRRGLSPGTEHGPGQKREYGKNGMKRNTRKVSERKKIFRVFRFIPFFPYSLFFLTRDQKRKNATCLSRPRLLQSRIITKGQPRPMTDL